MDLHLVLLLACAHAAPPATPAAPVPTAFAESMLAAHNRARCLHGVPPLAWSDDVAAYAQTWVNGLSSMQHSDSYQAPIGPLGENLYATNGPVNAADVVALWYSEGAQYRYGDDFQPGSGHFTAMIWRDARVLGCGVHDGIVSCNYGSGTKTLDCATPNLGGCFAAEVPRPVVGASCP